VLTDNLLDSLSVDEERQLLGRQFDRFLIEIGATQKISATAAYQFASAVFETGGAGGAINLMMFGRRFKRTRYISLLRKGGRPGAGVRAFWCCFWC
jgi:hypothetical protein